MKRSKDMRKRFLRELLGYAQESGTFNPHFHRKDMMKRLGLTGEGEFNIMQGQLGDKYCRYVDEHEGDARYVIEVSLCHELQDEFDREEAQESRLTRTIVCGAIITLIAVVLAYALEQFGPELTKRLFGREPKETVAPVPAADPVTPLTPSPDR